MAVPPQHAGSAEQLVHAFILEQLKRVRSSSGTGAATLAIGLSAPQGCGKTTLVTRLKSLLAAEGLRCEAVSFDDFYLTGAEQDAVAAASPDNALLQVRGNAGTHDLALASQTLSALRCASATAGVAVPQYDKSARDGRGDRAPVETWPSTTGALDVVLLEGWMAGFKPLPEGDARLTDIAPGLAEVNRNLAAYDALDSQLDAWVVLAVDDVSCVFDWRLQAERAMRADGRPGMTDDAVRDFVGRYMPAYRAYLPNLYSAARSPQGVDGRPTLLVKVGSDRRVVEAMEAGTVLSLPASV